MRRERSHHAERLCRVHGLREFGSGRARGRVIQADPPATVRSRLAALLVLASVARAGDWETRAYFPLHVGDWWAYVEQDDDGKTLARETWSVVPATREDVSGEFHVRSSTKRLDGLGRAGGHRWEGHEFLRRTPAGLEKRYPAGREGETLVLLLKEPLRAGTRWHDAQGDCEVSARGPCPGPRGELPDCAVVTCRLGEPTATVVTSTYARDIGMVRQEIQVVQFLPSLHGSAALFPSDPMQGGHSLLRLTAFHVGGR